MKKIYKYKLKSQYEQTIEMPGCDCQILSAAVKDGEVYIWAIVEPNSVSIYPVQITVYPTGVSLDLHLKNYIDTVHLPNGLVYHLFYHI